MAGYLHETSTAAAGSLPLTPDSYISSGLVAHAATQLAAQQGSIKLSQVKVCTFGFHRTLDRSLQEKHEETSLCWRTLTETITPDFAVSARLGSFPVRTMLRLRCNGQQDVVVQHVADPSVGTLWHACAPLRSDTCTQVEFPSDSSVRDADKQDNTGAPEWEVHITVLDTSAAPPHQAALPAQQSAAPVPAQRHRAEGADQEGVPPLGTAPHPGAEELEGHIGLSEQQNSRGHVSIADASAAAPSQSAGRDTSAGQSRVVFAGRGAPSADSPHETWDSVQSAGAQAKPQIAPWTDANGGLNEPYWRSLTQRAMSAVLRSPGMPGCG